VLEKAGFEHRHVLGVPQICRFPLLAEQNASFSGITTGRADLEGSLKLAHASFSFTASKLSGVSARKKIRSRLVGLAFAAVVPAAFWAAILALVAKLIGAPLSLSTLALIGAGIALFLFLVCGSLMFSQSENDRR
jgi:hypothetical protein